MLDAVVTNACIVARDDCLRGEYVYVGCTLDAKGRS